MKRIPILLLAAFCVALLSDTVSAQLFRDQMNDGSGWGINQGPDTDSSATFGYDYSADGIPEAPHSVGGDDATTGVKLEANNGDFIDSAAFFTLYPTGQNFTGDYRLRFDQWQNYDADEAAGAAVGTTEFSGGGIGYDNVTADIASGAQAISTGDGGSSNDWRAFKSPPQFFIPDADMVAGDHNASAAHYSDFLPSVAPPVSQGQSASSAAGSPGFQWITWEFGVIGDQVTILIEKPNGDRLNIVRYDKTDTSDGSAGVNTDGNISLFYADFFSSITPRPDLTFGIIDNVVVNVPEPATLGLLSLGLFGLVSRRFRR